MVETPDGSRKLRTEDRWMPCVTTRQNVVDYIGLSDPRNVDGQCCGRIDNEQLQ